MLLDVENMATGLAEDGSVAEASGGGRGEGGCGRLTPTASQATTIDG